MVEHYEDQLASTITQYRWAMALLGRVYANKVAQLKNDDRTASTSTSSSNARRRNGRGKISTEAVNSLLDTPSSPLRSRDNSSSSVYLAPAAGMLQL
jgi:hypothetical protein